MDFEKICMLFTMQEPYYGILLSSMRRHPENDPKVLPTIGVARSGGTFVLGYNENFIKNLDTDTILCLLKHEVLHLAFNHLTMWGDESKISKAEHNLHNIAEDLEVNCYLDRSKMKNVQGCWVEDFGWKKNLGAREYYKLLKSMIPPQQQQAQSPSKPCNGGQGGNQQQSQNQNQGSSQSHQEQQSNQQGQSQQGQQSSSGQNSSSGNQQKSNSYGTNTGNSKIDNAQSFDDHSQWPEYESDSQQQLMQQTIDELLVFAAEEVEKSCGRVPGELEGRIKVLREKKRPKPVADWKRFFRRYLGNEFSEQTRKSKKRESKRFPDAAGTRHRKKSHILVAIDTSGSVSMSEYQEFFGQIKTLTSSSTFHVVECDARIQHQYDFSGKVPQTLHGGGGTSFQPVVDLFHKNQRIYDALVYFTDGCAPIPKDTPKDTLWVISSKGDQSSRSKYQVNGASVVFIKKNK